MNPATETATSGPVPLAVPDSEVLVNKKEIAKRYGISLRKIDYLREQQVLPWYELPPRCIRFKPSECDAAMARYRRGGENDQEIRR